MLKEEFLVEYGLTQNHLAKAMGISPKRIAQQSEMHLVTCATAN
jgi:plasmid maintenance system antidote protein VapI